MKDKIAEIKSYFYGSNVKFTLLYILCAIFIGLNCYLVPGDLFAASSSGPDGNPLSLFLFPRQDPVANHLADPSGVKHQPVRIWGEYFTSHRTSDVRSADHVYSEVIVRHYL
jgi:hypothetical protein